jgi:hypothetical protein
MLRLGWDIDERAKAKNMHGDPDPVFGQKPLNEPLLQEFDICVLPVPSDVIQYPRTSFSSIQLQSPIGRRL